MEPQEGYRIPTQIHWVRGVVSNPFIRLAMGIGFVSGIYGCYCLFRMLPDSLPSTAIGLIVGGGIGLVEAMAGAYKDGTIEGFSFIKFPAAQPTDMLRRNLPMKKPSQGGSLNPCQLDTIRPATAPIAIDTVIDISNPNY